MLVNQVQVFIFLGLLDGRLLDDSDLDVSVCSGLIVLGSSPGVH